MYFHGGGRGYHWMWDSRCFNYGALCNRVNLLRVVCSIGRGIRAGSTTVRLQQ